MPTLRQAPVGRCSGGSREAKRTAAASGPQEREDVRIDDIRMGRAHPVRQAGIDLERALLHELHALQCGVLVWDDLVVVAIPERNVPILPAGLFAATDERVVVVDTGNYYPRQRDGRIEAIEAGMPESRWVEQQLGRPVIKVFNNIFAQHLLELGRPAGTPGRIALPVAGDDGAAKAVVLRLVDQLGFDGVDAGGLDESWRQQPGTQVYTTNLDAGGVRHALSEASRDRAPEWRAR